MIRYVFTRLAYMLPVVWLVVSVVFLLIHLVPGDPIQAMLGEGAAGADIQAARHAYGLDRPLPEQYVHYWSGVLHGDLGRSVRLDKPVKSLVAEAYPATLALTISALLVAVLLSIPAGVRSATHRNRWDDRALSFFSLLGLSFPNFALGPILILLFAIRLCLCAAGLCRPLRCIRRIQLPGLPKAEPYTKGFQYSDWGQRKALVSHGI